MKSTQQQGGRTVCICHEKGGTGKTITTVSLGIGLVRQGKKVLHIDADPQGDLSKCLGVTNPQGLANTLVTAMNSVIAEKPIDPESVIMRHMPKNFLNRTLLRNREMPRG